MSEAISLREFFQREGFTKPQALYLAENGLIEGAKLNPFSKKWCIEAPARLVDWLAALDRSFGSKSLPLRVEPSSGSSVMAVSCHADTHPTPAVEIPTIPSLADAFKVLGLPCTISPESEERSSEAPSLSGAVPEIFNSPKVLESVRSVRLAASELFYPVVLSGAQLLMIERALGHEVQAIKDRAEAHEFEPNAEVSAEHEMATVDAALRAFKRAVIDRHRENGYELRAEVSR